MPDKTIEADFLDRLYAVAMEPERFEELAEIWQAQLSSIEDEKGRTLGQGLRHLEAHLKRAETLITITTNQPDSIGVPLFERLNREPHPMLALTRDGKIAGSNDAARQIFDLPEAGKLSDIPIDDAALDTIRAAQRHRRTDLPGQRAELVRAWHSDSDTPLILSLLRWTTPSGRELLLVKAVDFIWPDKLTPLVKDAFGLTAAESEVMKHLAEGLTVADVAEARQASVATVRAQVRSLYEKMSIRSQSEFMRMTLGLTTLGLVDRNSITGTFQVPKSTASAPYPRPEDRHLFRLSDGRLMDYADFGDPGGRPVLFLHSEFFGDGCTGEMGDAARQKGLRFIAPARPHYGETSPYPPGAITYEQFAEDVSALLDHLKLPRVVCLSQVMAPSLFAITFAHLKADRLSGLVLLAPLYPFGPKSSEAKQDFFHRYLSSVIHRHPRMLRFISKAGMAFHNRVGTRRFFKTFSRHYPGDVAITDDDKGFAAMANGALLSSTKSYDGYFHDYRCLPEDIPGMLKAIEVPVRVITGNQFPRGAHETLLEITKQKPNFEEIIAENAGQYMMFSHPRLVLRTVEALCHNSPA